MMLFDKIRRCEKCESKPVPIYHINGEKIILQRAVAFILAFIIIYGTFIAIVCLLDG